MSHVPADLKLSNFRIAVLAILFLAVTTASHATVHPLNGNARFQIGDGLPIPIGFSAPPNGKIVPLPGAVVSQPAGADPREVVFAGGELKYGPVPLVIPVGINLAYQVFTSIGITLPHAGGTFAAGGRTGAATVSFCSGSVVSPSGNPGCASANAGTGPVKGLLVYTATSAQFGGPLAGRFYGTGNVALWGGQSSAPCSGSMCRWFMAYARPHSTGTGGFPGNEFGGTGMDPGTPPPMGALSATVLANGIIVAATPTPLSGPGLPNPATSVGAPWTTGRVTISQLAALGGAEVFILSGSDTRVSGVGSLSLVSGGLSNRGLGGPNGNRGWLNLVIGAPLGELPTMSTLGTTLLIGLLAFGATRALSRCSE